MEAETGDLGRFAYWPNFGVAGSTSEYHSDVDILVTAVPRYEHKEHHLGKRKAIEEPQLSCLHLRELTQRDRRFRLTTTHHY